MNLFLNIRGVRKVIDEKEKLSITIRDATVTITGVTDYRSTGNQCEAVTVPPANWFAFGIISLIKEVSRTSRILYKGDT